MVQRIICWLLYLPTHPWQVTDNTARAVPHPSSPQTRRAPSLVLVRKARILLRGQYRQGPRILQPANRRAMWWFTLQTEAVTEVTRRTRDGSRSSSGTPESSSTRGGVPSGPDQPPGMCQTLAERYCLLFGLGLIDGLLHTVGRGKTSLLPSARPLLNAGLPAPP